MKFSEAFGREVGYGVGIEATIRGFLVVTASFSYLSESESAEAQSNQKAILVSWPDLADALMNAGAPGRVGSMVLFAGEAEVTGMLNRTGMGLAPVSIYAVRELTYWQDGQQFKLKQQAT